MLLSKPFELDLKESKLVSKLQKASTLAGVDGFLETVDSLFLWFGSSPCLTRTQTKHNFFTSKKSVSAHERTDPFRKTGPEMS